MNIEKIALAYSEKKNSALGLNVDRGAIRLVWEETAKEILEFALPEIRLAILGELLLNVNDVGSVISPREEELLEVLVYPTIRGEK